MSAVSHDIVAIDRRIELRAAPESVWQALTDPAELGSWFADSADLDVRAGGEGWLAWAEHGRFAIRVEQLEPPHRFAFRWARDADTPITEGTSTLVEWWLDAAPGGGTSVRLRESGFQREGDRSVNVQGWFDELPALAAHVAEETWEAGIRKTYRFRSAPERVWLAFADPVRFGAWFGGDEPFEMRAGTDGWFAWPSEGRFAVRVEAVEPIRYLCWRWATEPDLAVDVAPETLRTEWLLIPRDDGGTDLHLLETGFRGPKNRALNDEGWDGDVIPALRRVLGESE
jgi:uncharacterized protein YndB with AHSA1/START domain